MQLNDKNYWRAFQVAITTKMLVKVEELISQKVIVTSAINR